MAEDDPDFVSFLHRPDGGVLVALLRYHKATDDYTPVKVSRVYPQRERDGAVQEGRAWAAQYQVEFRP